MSDNRIIYSQLLGTKIRQDMPKLEESYTTFLSNICPVRIPHENSVSLNDYSFSFFYLVIHEANPGRQ